MPRRAVLSEAQRTALLALPDTESELVGVWGAMEQKKRTTALLPAVEITITTKATHRINNPLSR